jgi:hypothetical protein
MKAPNHPQMIGQTPEETAGGPKEGIKKKSTFFEEFVLLKCEISV